jgi:hypothetical protein
MAETKNPYEHAHDQTVYLINNGVAWRMAIVFMVVLWLPALSEHARKALAGQWSETPAGKLLAWRPAQGSIVQHLHDVEKSLDSADYSTAIRQRVQGWLTRFLGEGNSKVFVGFDGRLFYHPDLQSLTGYGPLKPEPFSVMKDPELAKLPETRDMVKAYAAQLKERGIDLLLVPVPLKPMLYSEYITGKGDYAWVTHPDQAAFYQQLRDSGVDVLDLTADMATLRSKKKFIYQRIPEKRDSKFEAEEEARMKKTLDAFLVQDTHWTPEAMRLSAEKVAAYVKEKYPKALDQSFRDIRITDGLHHSSEGDLVNLLDMTNSEDVFDYEEAFLRSVTENTQSRDSSIVLLGDSFVNIYDDPTLGFEYEAKPSKRLSAGFAQHLSFAMKQPLDVIAMNGKGATGVRRELAQRTDDEVRTKKLVVWVIAARDLLLSKTAAHNAGIEWGAVTFNPKRRGGALGVPAATAETGLIVDVKLVEKSRNQSLDSPYRNALHTALYDVEKVVSGAMTAKQVLGVQWTFQEKQMSPTAGFTAGGRYRLTLVPWDKKPDLKLLNLEDSTSAFDAERWFVEKAEVLK